MQKCVLVLFSVQSEQLVCLLLYFVIIKIAVSYLLINDSNEIMTKSKSIFVKQQPVFIANQISTLQQWLKNEQKLNCPKLVTLQDMQVVLTIEPLTYRMTAPIYTKYLQVSKCNSTTAIQNIDSYTHHMCIACLKKTSCLV